MVRIAAVLLTLLMLFCSLSLGCITSQEAKPSVTGTSQITTGTTPSVNIKEMISISVEEPIRFYIPEGGCYYDVTFKVRNTDVLPQQNIVILINLVDTVDGSVDSTAKQPVERINGNESKGFTIRKMYGECDTNYRVQALVI